ncbi:hypothetical protein P175DRAFT_0500340 [Aspergillus ochraceoroseus IBT 24754]|uniref:UBC core domain-containing protein n=2 Tax=Aspergillus ochraceoroseus TaxID=138278 RepID=A0A2T5LYU6_9EURO|nr:uncharacterized protein P175DRAFT_0500340 [Aspergillus ochraceoroseus IBT 24754]KKK18806.1 hypothetical protein AOCH_002890 [Aspergillus ochraceoroseus]PTU21442.1 hypothetical protein P175DRAFT_0500340 [Aspergillus ochraceoroseus IBT 24754]
MDSGFVSPVPVYRHNQKFDRDDACYLKSNPTLLGHVVRTPYDVDEHELLSDVLILRYTEIPENDLMSFTTTGVPPKGYVFVSFVEPSHGCALIHEDDLELVDRVLDLGQTVKRHPDDTISGTIISTTATCTLEPIAFQPVDPVTGEYGPLRFTEKPLNNMVGSQAAENAELGPPLLYDISLSDLTKHEEFSEGDFIIYRQKLGVIQQVERDAVLLLPNLKVTSPLDPFALELPLCSNPKAVVSLPETDALKSHDIGNGEYLWTSETEFIFPGQATITDASNISRGDLPPGMQSLLVQGYVMATPSMDVHIDWLCPNVFSAESRYQTPNSEVMRASALQGTAVKCDFGRPLSESSSSSSFRCDSQLEIGDRVRFRNTASAVTKYSQFRHIPADQTFGYDLNIFRIVSSRTQVAVQWQDGTVSAEQGTSLHKIASGEDELWPGNIVVLKDRVEAIGGPLTHNAEPFPHFLRSRMRGALRIPQVGIVQAVDSRERIASVRWYDNMVELFYGGNALNPYSSLGVLSDTITNVSIYELTTYGGLSRFLDDLVILAPESVDRSAIIPSPSDEPVRAVGPCQLSFLSPITYLDLSVYLQAMKSAMINSAWFKNTTRINTSPTHRRYSVHNENTDGSSSVNFFGKIVGVDTNGIITVRLPGAASCRDICVPLERILMVIDLDESIPAVPVQSFDFLTLAGMGPFRSRDDSSTFHTFEYEGGERLDNDSADDNWMTEDESYDSADSDELIPVPERMVEGGEVVVTAVSEINPPEKPDSHHEGESSIDNAAKIFEEINILHILSFPTPSSCPQGFVVLEDSPPLDHHFLSKSTLVSSRLRMKRIRKEFEVLESSLPPGIFVRTWESRMDLLRVMIIGPEGTPYEHAPYLIDFHLNEDFPNSPPSTFFHSWTNGQGAVNPNLYEDGKICLSILGTWPTENPDETWSPLKSTVLQILVSIMGLVLVKAPFYNEAGYEVLAVEDSRRVESSQYTEKAFLLTRKFIHRALQYPVAGLEDVLNWYYVPDPSPERPQLLRRAIIEALGMIEHHNRTSHGQNDQDKASVFFSRLSLGAVVMLRKHVTALERLELDLMAQKHS